MQEIKVMVMLSNGAKFHMNKVKQIFDDTDELTVHWIDDGNTVITTFMKQHLMLWNKY